MGPPAGRPPMAEPGTIGPPCRGAATRPVEPAWTTRLATPSGTFLTATRPGGTRTGWPALLPRPVRSPRRASSSAEDRLARTSWPPWGVPGTSQSRSGWPVPRSMRGRLVAVALGDPQGGHEGGPVARADVDGERPLDVESRDDQLGGAAVGDRLVEVAGRPEGALGRGDLDPHLERGRVGVGDQHLGLGPAATHPARERPRRLGGAL